MLSDLKYLALTLVLIIAVGCSVKNNDEPFAVSGHVENVEDGYMILFFKSNLDGSTTTIAIDTLKNGRFEFSAPAETGVQYHVIAPHVGIFPSMAVDFYTEPGARIEILGKDYLTGNWTVKTKVKDQKIYQSYFDEVADIFKDLQHLELKCRKEGRSTEYLDLNKPYHAKLDSIRLKWLKNQKRISEPWMDLMLGSAKSAAFSKDKASLNELQLIWKKLAPQHKDSPKGKQVSTVIYPDGEPLKAGDAFPYDIQAYDLEDNLHSLSEFKGKAMLLYFGSYSCAPCRGAKKELTELFNSDNCPVEVIGFNLDTEASWKVGSGKNPVPWHDFNDLKGSYGFNRRFETQGIPTFVIVSKEGKILDIWAGHRVGIIGERLDAAL